MTVLQLNLQADGTLALLDLIIIVVAALTIGYIIYRAIKTTRFDTRTNIVPLSIVGIAALYALLRLLGMETIPVEYLSMLPYLATIAVLVGLRSGGAAASLGKTFHPSS